MGLAIALIGCGFDSGGTPADDTPDSPDAASDPPDAPWPPPIVEITSHDDGARILGSRTITIAGVIDSWVTIDAVSVAAGDADVIATFDDASFSAEIALGDGATTITVTATSSAGDGSDAVDLTYPFVALTSFASASRVIGQPDFVTATAPAAGPSGTPFPYGRVDWDGETLFVPSSDFNRILGFDGIPATDGAAADFAIGQPDLQTVTAGVGADGMEFPQTVQEEGGRLYVLDWVGSRIMGWSTVPATSGVAADFVIGQADLDAFKTGCDRDAVDHPDDFFVGAGKLIVSDTNNNRVLIYDTIPTASGALPDLVLGQADFSHCTANDDNQDGFPDLAPTARSMADPIGVWTDGTRLFVVEGDNNRVLVWNTFPTASFEPADFVLGQPSFGTTTPATTATGLRHPISVASNGNQLAIADDDNSRVLIWNSMPTAPVAPDVVIGQGDFTHGQPNDDDQNGIADLAPTARTLDGTAGVEFVEGALVVSDLDNSRILFFGPAP